MLTKIFYQVLILFSFFQNWEKLLQSSLNEIFNVDNNFQNVLNKIGNENNEFENLNNLFNEVYSKLSVDLLPIEFM